MTAVGGPEAALRSPPEVDRVVVAAQKDVGHVTTAEDAGTGVMWILDAPFPAERLILGRPGGAENAEAHNGSDAERSERRNIKDMYGVENTHGTVLLSLIRCSLIHYAGQFYC